MIPIAPFSKSSIYLLRTCRVFLYPIILLGAVALFLAYGTLAMLASPFYYIATGKDLLKELDT